MIHKVLLRDVLRPTHRARLHPTGDEEDDNSGYGYGGVRESVLGELRWRGFLGGVEEEGRAGRDTAVGLGLSRLSLLAPCPRIRVRGVGGEWRGETVGAAGRR